MKNPLGVLKEHKEVALMIFGTLTEVGAVVLAVRNGIKAKEKLDDMPEDATFTEKAVKIAPEVLPVVGLASLSIGSYWWARHINIDRIISASSVAAMAIQNKKNQDEAVKETVDEKTYSDVQAKTVEKNMVSNGYSYGYPVFDMGTSDATIFVEKQSCGAIRVTKEWIRSKFYEWKTEAMKGGDVSCKGLYCDYFMLPERSWMEDTGWKHRDISNLDIKFEYPKEKPEDSDFGVPYTIFSVSIEPDVLVPFR